MFLVAQLIGIVAFGLADPKASAPPPSFTIEQATIFRNINASAKTQHDHIIVVVNSPTLDFTTGTVECDVDGEKTKVPAGRIYKHADPMFPNRYTFNIRSKERPTKAEIKGTASLSVTITPTSSPPQTSTTTVEPATVPST